MLIAMTATEWSIIIAAIFVGVCSPLKLYLEYRERKETRKALEEVRLRAEAAAVQVNEVKQTLRYTNQVHGDKLDEIHELCNGAMGEQKKLVAVSARALADSSPTPVTQAAAKAAEEIYADHLAAVKKREVM